MTTPHKLLAAIAWAILIIAACSIPGTDLPDIDIRSIDKIAHFTLFAVLAWLWLRALRISVPTRYIVVIFSGSIFGGLTEIYQGLLPWERTPDLSDAIANALGLLAGSGLYAVRNRRKRVAGSNL